MRHDDVKIILKGRLNVDVTIWRCCDVIYDRYVSRSTKDNIKDKLTWGGSFAGGEWAFKSFLHSLQKWEGGRPPGDLFAGGFCSKIGSITGRKSTNCELQYLMNTTHR